MDGILILLIVIFVISLFLILDLRSYNFILFSLILFYFILFYLTRWQVRMSVFHLTVRKQPLLDSRILFLSRLWRVWGLADCYKTLIDKTLIAIRNVDTIVIIAILEGGISDFCSYQKLH